MKCLYCGTDLLEDWVYCGNCGVNIKEYEKADEFIKKGLELESQFEYAKASEEYKHALEIPVPQDKILEHLERVTSKEQVIIDGMNKGGELLESHKWRNAICMYKKVLKLNPHLNDEINPKLIHAKSMFHKSRKGVKISWIIVGVIVVIGIIGWQLYVRAPEQVAHKTLRQGVLSPSIQEKMVAIEALGGLKDKRFTPLLKDALKDDNPEIRAVAARALGKIDDSSAISVLKESLFDKNWEVRVESAHSLVLLGDSSGIQLLRDAIK